MLYQELKERTTPMHHALEKKLIERIKGVKSTHDYVDLLKLMYGYYAAAEERLEKFYHPEIAGLIKNRRKAKSIISDLARFQKPQTPATCQHVPEIGCVADALGMMYVLEGSTLGGKIIAGMIARQIQVTPNDGLSFFTGYGENTQAQWEAFKKELERPFSSDDREKLINAASNTFLTFRRWIDEYEAN